MRFALLVVAVAAAATLRPGQSAQLPGSGTPEQLPASLQAAFEEQAGGDFRFARSEMAVAEEGAGSTEEQVEGGEPAEAEPAEAEAAPKAAEGSGDAPAAADGPASGSDAGEGSGDKSVEGGAKGTGASSGATGATGGSTGATGATGSAEPEEPADELEPEEEEVDPAAVLGKAMVEEMRSRLTDEKFRGEVMAAVGEGESAALDARLLHTSTGAAGVMKRVIVDIDEMEQHIDAATKEQMARQRAQDAAEQRKDAMADLLKKAGAELSEEESGKDTDSVAAVHKIRKDAEGAVDMYAQLKALRKQSTEYIAKARDASQAALDTARSEAPVDAVEAHLQAMRNATQAAHTVKKAFFDLKKHLDDTAASIKRGMENQGLAPAIPNPEADSEDEGADPVASRVEAQAMEARVLAQQADASTEYARRLENAAQAEAEHGE